jgi:hypothetical protein
MLLKEMFSPLGAPKEDQTDIDWIGDLKFFIDNDDAILNQHFFPAIKKHEQYQGHPDAYKIYLKPLHTCLETYCNKFEVEDPGNKFPKEKLIELARKFAMQQERFMERGDYKK